jgi:hypothetical protein
MSLLVLNTFLVLYMFVSEPLVLMVFYVGILLSALDKVTIGAIAGLVSSFGCSELLMGFSPTGPAKMKLFERSQGGISETKLLVQEKPWSMSSFYRVFLQL